MAQLAQQQGGLGEQGAGLLPMAGSGTSREQLRQLGARQRALAEQLERLGCRPGPGGQAQSGAPRERAAGGALDVLDVADVLNQCLRDEDIIVEEATTSFEPLRTRLRRDEPGTYFRSGGSGLGWGLGAALGVQLAHPARRIVAVVGDGSFLFSSPAAALWTLRQSEAPVLILVLCNGGYAASRRPVFTLFPDGASAASGEVVGTLFPQSPDLDFAALARACGAEGERAGSVTELRACVERGLEAARPFVVAVDVTSPWIAPPPEMIKHSGPL
jgi:thiamine pyrophosphate-dependent acetolactate synthase large subunit-like protein